MCIRDRDVTGNPETRITVDKEKAMQYGLTVAQVYSKLATALQSETSATTLTIGADDVPVVIIQDSACLLYTSGTGPTGNTGSNNEF